MRKYILTEEAVTGAGVLQAGADITSLQPNERIALCQLGKAVAVAEKDAPKAMAEIAAQQKALAEAEAARVAADIAANIEANKQPEPPEELVAVTPLSEIIG